MMRMLFLILAFVAFAIASIYLWWGVHCTLDYLCTRHARRFCRRQGLEVRRSRAGIAFDQSGMKTEFTIVELDCLDAQKQRKLIRLLVWLFGVRKVLSNEIYPDSHDAIKTPNAKAKPTPAATQPKTKHSVEYSYNPNPSWTQIFSILFVSIIPPIAIPSTPIYIISALFLLIAFGGVIRLIFLKRNVILTDKTITVPSGLFKMFPKTCELNDIIEFSDKRFGYGLRAMSLTTETNKYEIVLMFMKPDEYYELSDKIYNTLLEIKGKPLHS